MIGTSALTKATGLEFEFLPYSAFMLAVSFASIVLFMLAGKFLLRIDTSRMKDADFTKLSGNLQYTTEQKIGTALLLFILLALYLPSVLSKESTLYMILNNLGAVGVVGIATVLLLVIPINGQPLMDFQKTASAGIQWNMICLLACVGPLGSALMSENANITKSILVALQPILAGQSPMTMYIFLIVICLVLTQFMNNTVLLVVLTPMLCKLAGLVNANPFIITAILVFALSAALATPGASSRAGLIFGNTEWIATKDAYLQGILSVVSVMLALLIVGLPLGILLF